MQPEDLQDIVFAFFLLVLLVVAGIALKLPSSGGGDKVVYRADAVKDEENILLLNFLRSEINGLSVADLIISEDRDNVKDILEEKMGDIMGKVDRWDHEYGLRITYPDGDFVDLGCTFDIAKGVEQKLPSLNGEIINLEFALQGDECISI